MAIKAQVGQMAGEVWELLASDGPLTLAQLKMKLNAQAEIRSYALGWLAREDKIEFIPEKKTVRIQLK